MVTSIKRFFDKLAKSNEKEFQGKSPDCCTINKAKQLPKRQHSNVPADNETI